MTLDDILTGLFPNGRKIETNGAMITGQAALPDGEPIHVLGVTQAQPLGVDDEERALRTLKGAKGKRLTYQTTRGGQSGEEEIPF